MELPTRLAIDLATKAGSRLKEGMKSPKETRGKEAGVHADVVTAFDVSIEEEIIAGIRAQFPDHAILSEETNGSVDPLAHDRLWIIDPIDGTISFASGLPLYSVSIAYFENQKPRSSALYLASMDEVLWAETGLGAYSDETKLTVRDLPPEESVIALDQGVRTRKVTMAGLAPTLALGIRALLMIPGEAGNLGLVARGNIQGLVCAHPQVWDFAAGMHLAQEAGAKVTDFAGNPYSWFERKGHIVATERVLPYILEHAKGVAPHFV